MRILICFVLMTLLASCALLEPEIDEPQVAARQSDSLVDGFQSLHQGRHERALRHFDAAQSGANPQDPIHIRALLGKALIHLHEQDPWRDLDQSERYIQQAERQIIANDGTESITDWILRTSTRRLLEAERRVEEADRRMTGLEQTERELRQAREQVGRINQLENELATTRAEKEQAEETIARLRNLIMDE